MPENENEVIVDGDLEIEAPAPEPTEEEIKLSKAVEKRIGKEVYKRREAERKYEATQAELAQIRAQLAQVQPEVNRKTDSEGRPDPNKYAAGVYDPEYIEALTDYKVDMRTRQILDEQQNKTTMALQSQKIDALEAEAVKAHSDYLDVISGVLEHPIAGVKAFQDLLNDADNPAELSYYLGNNPDELDKLLDMNERQASRYLGKLEDKIATQSPPTKKLSDAPTPPSPLKGAKTGNVVTDDPEKMTMAQYAVWRKSQQKR
jgi:uncharacterized protein with FMN-binding domain